MSILSLYLKNAWLILNINSFYHLAGAITIFFPKRWKDEIHNLN